MRWFTWDQRGPSNLPQLFSGNEHLGQPLQLCSLLLHGVPDPVHLSKARRTETHSNTILHRVHTPVGAEIVHLYSIWRIAQMDRKTKGWSVNAKLLSENKQCPDTSDLLTFREPWRERSVSVIIPLMIGEKSYSNQGRTWNNAGSQKSQPAAPSAAVHLEFLEKPNVCTHAFMHPCVRPPCIDPWSAEEVFMYPGLGVSVGLVCLSLINTHTGEWMHVLLHAESGAPTRTTPTLGGPCSRQRGSKP